MPTREYSFNSSIETPTLPTAGTPTADDDFVTLGYFNQNTGGTGEINYIDDGNAESQDIGSWGYFDDGAVSVPGDGADGSQDLLTMTAQASTVLRGSYSFKVAKASGDAQGQGIALAFSIKGQDTNKKLKIQFDYKTDEDTIYDTGDFGVWIYDVTNSTLITPVDTDIPDGQNIFQTSFNSTDSLSYRLIFMCTTTETTAYDIYLDDIIVGPGMTSQGAAIGDWIEFTGSVTASANPTTPGTFNCFYRRVGSAMELVYNYNQTSGGSTGTGSYLMSLPSGYTIDTDHLATPGNFTDFSAHCGSGFVKNSADHLACSVQAYDSTHVYLTGVYEAGEGVWGSGFFPLSNNPMDFGFKATIPITEWAGKGIVPMLAEDNLSEWQDVTPSFNNLTVGNATLTGAYRRVGDSMEYFGSLTLGSTSSITGQLTLNIPNSLNIATTSFNEQVYGVGSCRDVGTQKYTLAIVREANTYVHFNTDSTDSPINATTPFTWTTSDWLTWSFRVPIAEWAGSQNSLVGYSTYQPGTQTGLVEDDGLKGFTDASSATAGYLGEVIEEANTSGTTPGDTTNLYNIDDITLTAGDWDVHIVMGVSGNASSTTFRCAFSTDSTSPVAEGSLSPAIGFNNLDNDFIFNVGNSPASDQAIVWPVQRINISSSDTYYLKVRTAAVAVAVRSRIIARRVR